MEVITRKCPGCGSPQVRVDRHEARAQPMEWACGSCGRIDRTPKSPTARELELIRGICEGKGTKEVAALLGISTKTAETHRNNVMKKLGVHCTAELVRWAIREKVIEA